MERVKVEDLNSKGTKKFDIDDLKSFGNYLFVRYENCDAKCEYGILYISCNSEFVNNRVVAQMIYIDCNDGRLIVDSIDMTFDGLEDLLEDGDWKYLGEIPEEENAITMNIKYRGI